MFKVGDSRVPQRIWAQVQALDSGCWEWTGKLTTAGYGKVSLNGETTVAHRVIYQLILGQLPRRVYLDHSCHNTDASCPGGNGCVHRRCVNPGHLAQTTPRGNVFSSPDTQARMNREKTHCLRGHPLSGGNLKISKKGNRSCRECGRAASERWFAKNRERENARSREYYELNREKISERSASWYKENREEVRARAKARYDPIKQRERNRRNYLARKKQDP